jgi:Rrf2 family protein
MKDVLRISEAASLALHTMAVLAAEPDRIYSNRDIAGRLGVSSAHLAKVLQRLTRAGLLHSERGPGGGFKLGRPLDDVSLLEVYEAIEGPFEPRVCLLHEKSCSGTECIFGELLRSTNRKFRKFLETRRVAELGGLYPPAS